MLIFSLFNIQSVKKSMINPASFNKCTLAILTARSDPQRMSLVFKGNNHLTFNNNRATSLERSPEEDLQ